MTGPRALAAGLAYRLATHLPTSAVGRARTAGRLTPMLESAYAALGAPLYGAVLPIAHGPAAGLRILGERRSLAWLAGKVESDVQLVLSQYLQPAGTFVDVGASIGFFTLLAARIVGPAGRVIAFEPQPAAARSVRRNAELNGFANVTVVEAAVGSFTGDVNLEGVGTATAHVVADSRPVAAGVRVASTSLDDFLAAQGGLVPDLVKIDAEGAEPDVIGGMRMTLTAGQTVLVIECHDNAARILAPLPDGYAVSVLGSDVPARAAPRTAHLLARPRAHGMPAREL